MLYEVQVTGTPETDSAIYAFSFEVEVDSIPELKAQVKDEVVERLGGGLSPVSFEGNVTVVRVDRTTILDEVSFKFSSEPNVTFSVDL